MKKLLRILHSSEDAHLSMLGTGGHSEYVRIWNASGTIAGGNWTGYGGDWHTISFDKPFILKANETHKYTICTGSYPQMIHKPAGKCNRRDNHVRRVRGCQREKL